MSWKYYKNGKLIEECDDIPETMEDAVIELQENGHDVSDCVVEPESNKDDTLPPICDDFWSPDYPPEEVEYADTITFKPLTDKDVKDFEKVFDTLLKDGKALKAPKDFTDKLYGRIHEETGVNMKPTRLDSIKSWWLNVTTGEKAYLSFWIIWLYLLLGLVITQEPRIVGMVCEIILWPFFM